MVLRIVLRTLMLFALVLPANGQAPAEMGPSPDSRVAHPLNRQQHDTATPGSAVDPFMTKLTPHPYIFVSPALMGAGYALIAYRVEGGLNVESSRYVMSASAAYDSGHQVNDGNQPNRKGHDRYLDSAIYFRPARGPFFGKVFVGFGWRWNQLSTTKYIKTANRPQVGCGFDITHHPCSGCRRDFSMRLAVNWVMAGHDWQNGSHGSEIVVSLPSPRERRHWFYQQRLGIYRFHATVTDRSNRSLVQSEQADRAFACYANFGILYRF
jgi:hypothetical protein